MANEASPNRLMKVWYSLNDRIDSVKVGNDADISDLRDAIIARNPPLQSLCPGTIDIYRPGTTSFESRNNQVLDPGDIVPNDTSSNAENGKGPLIVVPPPLPPSPTLQQQQQQLSESAYLVGAIVRGAKQSNGARGNVFKLLERHLGHYSEQEGIQILYEQDNLTIKAYFVSYDSACQFQTAMNEWEIHKELANLKGVTLDPLTPAKINRPKDLRRIYLQDYKPQESESPCETLNQLHSYRLSVPKTEPVEAETPLARYQSVDKVIPHLKHYKCHLKDKARFKQLQDNENNMVAASWTFYQQMDGLNVDEGIPLVALTVKEASSCRSAAHENRYPVTLSIRFFYSDLASSFAAQQWANRSDRDTWETVVYVQDKDLFIECVEWKFQHTTKQWQEHRTFLDQE